MGFRPEATIYTLKFEEGHWLHGLHVKVGCCTIKEFNDMLRRNADSAAQVADNNEESIELFLKYLKEWDLENPSDGQPTPKTLEGLGQHEQILIRELMTAWQKAQAGIDDDLGKDSTTGNISLEQELGLGG